MSEAPAMMAPPHHDEQLNQLLDQAVLSRDSSSVPPEHRPACEAVLQAWTAYENGQDDAAREALKALSLTSPFNEWKLLLRGLMASMNKDTARALENFRRLKPERVPARLALPFWAALDPTQRATLPPDRMEKFRSFFVSKNTQSVLNLLRKLQQQLSQDKPFSHALKTAVKLLPELRLVAPQLIPMLTEVLYAQLDLKGTPTDLREFRVSFRLPSDPEFHVLEARKLEDIAPDRAAKHVQKYIAWLTTNPLGWADELHRRVLANFWLNLAELEPTHRPRALQEAALLDPDSEVVMRLVLEDAARSVGPGQYAAMAQDFLRRHPEATTIRRQVLKHLARIPGGCDYYLGFAKLLLEHNPLDEAALRWFREGLAYHFARHFGQLDWSAVEKLIQAESRLSTRHGVSVPLAAELVLQSRLLPAKAVTERLARTDLDFFGRVAAWCFAHLSRYKPSQRKPFELWLRASLTADSKLEELTQASCFLSLIETSLSKITGTKKLQTDISRSISERLSDLTAEEQFEDAVLKVMRLSDKKPLLKMLQSFKDRFPRSPVLIMSLVSLQLSLGNLSGSQLKRLEMSLNHLLHLIQTRPEPRYQKLLPEVKQLLNSVLPQPSYRELWDLFNS